LEAFGQSNPYWQRPTPVEADSLKMVLQSSENDFMKMYINRQLGLYYSEINRYTALEYLKAQLDLAQSLNQKIWEAEALTGLGFVSSLIANYPGSLNYLLAASDIASNPEAAKNIWNVSLLTDDGKPNSARLTILAVTISHLGLLHFLVGNYEKSIEYLHDAAELNKIRQDEVLRAIIHLNLGESYLGMRSYELAKTELEEAVTYSNSTGYNKYVGLIYLYIGRIFEAEGDYNQAEKYYDMSVVTNIEANTSEYLGMAYRDLARLNRAKGFLDSSYVLALKALSTNRAVSDTLGLISTHRSLAIIFDARAEIDSAYYHMKSASDLNSAMNREERIKEFQVLGLNEQLRLRELETEKVLFHNRIRMYGLAVGIGVLLLISMITYRSNRRQKKDKAIIETSYANLKATQAQLVQQEKLASLGQLTAGIAHEIKNPLNFVNNFSEVSSELIDEVFEELEKLDSSDAKAEIIAILNDVKSNLIKVHEHGTRADIIVKSMLQHSRGGSGKMEPTDLNALIKEYTNLAFHGMRAGKNPINVTIDLQLDEQIKTVPLVEEDFSRVLLNLCNNAFDAMRGKLNLSGLLDYQPKLTIRTKSDKDHVTIEVEDNGPGIPDDIKDKILQPFFTTKKGTEGTGLGLSITNDIVKAHGGSIEVVSKENAGAAFVIILIA
jgi:signal transduction histidine kinase